MSKTLWLINGIFILAFGAAIIWSFFAIGKPEFFDRHAIVLVLMAPCLAFIAYRRIRRKP